MNLPLNKIILQMATVEVVAMAAAAVVVITMMVSSYHSILNL
jgi:hypothetical protein